MPAIPAAACLALLLSVLAGTAKNLVSRAGGEAFAGARNLNRANLVTALLALPAFGLGGLALPDGSRALFLALAAAFGLATLLAQSLFILAVKAGPVSVCSLLYSCGFLVPTAYASLGQGEPVGGVRAAGIALVLASMALVTLRPGPAERTPATPRTPAWRWLLPAFGALVSSGVLGVIQRVYRDVPTWTPDHFGTFLFLSFAAMLAAAAAAHPFLAPAPAARAVRPLRALGFCAVLALCILVANRLNIQLAGELPGALFFPVSNGGRIALTALIARPLFGERLSPLQVLGILLSLPALALVAR